MNLLPKRISNAEVLDTLQKLRREFREWGEASRGQQSVHNDKQEGSMKMMIERLDRLITAWEKMARP